MPRIQANRKAAVITPLGEDALLLKSLSGTEELGRLFRLELELLSENHEIKFDEIVGQNATVRLSLPEGKTRYWNGFVIRFAQLPSQGEVARYQATLAPWLWFLTRTSDCRIFQEMTAPDIIQQVFRDHQFTDFKVSLSESYRTRDYCTQYRETDFDFVSRLMEEEGIYYFFEHENGKHTLVLADSKSAHSAYPGYETILHRYQDQTGVEQEYIYDWILGQDVQPGIVCLNDFDFEKPNKALTVKANITRAHAVPNFEIFDHPGGYVEYSDGETYARRRIEELQAQHERVRGSSRAKGICPGYLFTLERHARQDQNREYLVTSASCQILLDPFSSAPPQEQETFFTCSFTAVHSETPFRSARLIRPPVVPGPQTAMVVGPKGEEIYTDKYGRVKVQFHWDRRGQGDENSSCWLRVSQLWAGKSFGAICIPRIGQEVIVDFLEGNPDQPLVTGRVYNGESMPPYKLPDQKTITSTKSNSTIGGKGFNEIRFEDKKGDEQLFIHAEKNQDTRVKNNAYEWVGNDRHLIVKKDQIEHVENNRHETVDADHVEKIGKDRHLKIVGKEAKAVDGSHSFSVKGDVIEVFDKNHSEVVTKDYYLKADNIVIEGKTNVTIKVGQTHIALEAGGVKIGTSGQIKVESMGATTIKATGPMKVESSATTDIKGAAASLKADAMVEVNGSATVMVKGGIVMIN